MDSVDKFLNRIPNQDLKKIAIVIDALLQNKTRNLDIKKMRGHVNVYRVKIGNYRLIYVRDSDNIRILFAGKRNEKTYRDF